MGEHGHGKGTCVELITFYHDIHVDISGAADEILMKHGRDGLQLFAPWKELSNLEEYHVLPYAFPTYVRAMKNEDVCGTEHQCEIPQNDKAEANNDWSMPQLFWTNSIKKIQLYQHCGCGARGLATKRFSKKH